MYLARRHPRVVLERRVSPSRCRFWVVVLIGGLLATPVWGQETAGQATPTADRPLDEQTPESVLITFEMEGKLVAIRLAKENQIAVLESCFPGYRDCPAGEAMTAWKSKYEIYFNFARGKTIRVGVSSNSRYWSTGQGAIEMRGAYFNNLMHQLLQETMRSAE